jgi:hypothetical protein
MAVPRWRTIPGHRTRIVAGMAMILVVGTALWIQWSPSTLTRQQAMAAARQTPWGFAAVTNRIEAKLVHRSDLTSFINDENPLSHPWDRVWAVAAQGDLGAATMACCSQRPTTWSVAIVPDQEPARVEVYSAGSPQAWPPFWDRLLDLSLASRLPF